MKSLAIRMQMFRGSLTRLAPLVLLAALFTAAPFRAAMAQAVAPTLGTTQSFAVLGGASVVNTGSTVIVGDVGVSPGTVVSGFPPGTETGGTIHATDALAGQAQIDTTAAYLNLAGQKATQNLTGKDLGGLTLTKGVYSFSTSAQLTGALTLDGQGDPTAVWVFQIGSTLTTASGSSVVLVNSANPCNVFWQVGSSATLGSTTNFVGNIFALTSITLITGATADGRLLAQNGTVTLDTNTVSITACGAAGTPIPPTVNKAFSPVTINAGAASTLTITLNNANTTAASLSAPLIDTLPSGLLVSGSGSTTCGGTLTAIAGSSTVTLTGGSIPVNGSCTLTLDVAAATGGSYINSLAVGALVTSNGASAAPAVATLTVSTPSGVTLGKAFSPATIAAGAISTLTITLSNGGTTMATLTAALTDALPSGVFVAGGVTSTCIAPLTGFNIQQQLTRQPRMEAVAFRMPVRRLAWLTGFGSTVSIAAGSSIPAGSSCTVTVPVTAPVAGSYFNSLPAGALQTNAGNNAAPAVATLTANATTNMNINLTMVTPGTVQITRGVPATVMLSVVTNPSNIPIPVDVSFGCAVPAELPGTTCSLNPGKVKAGSPSGSSTILTINTIRGAMNANSLPFGPGPRLPWYFPWASAATLLALIGLLGFARNSASRRLLPYYLTGALLVLAAGGLGGCSGSTAGTASLSAGASGSTSVAGTPPGPSVITVTTSAAGMMKTVSIPIIVN